MNRVKRIIVYLLIFSMIIPCSFASIFAEENSIGEGFDKITENQNLVLYANIKTAEIAVMNKKTGFIWRSNAQDKDNDTVAQGVFKMELYSQMIVNYIDTKNVLLKVNNYVGSIKPQLFKSQKVNKGIKFTFTFNKEKFVIPLEYTLEDNYLNVKINTDEIEEGEAFRIVSINLLPYFGAGDIDDNGYIFIPDGPGGIINFNNGKTEADTYYSRVYGNDLSINTYTDYNNYKEIMLPVFGIKNGNDAFLAVINKGASQGKINADIANKFTSYNSSSAEFILREAEEYVLAREINAATTSIKYSQLLKNEAYELRYYFLSDNNANYSGMAKTYQDYLVKEKNLKQSESVKEVPFFLELIGGLRKKKSILGIPVEVTYKLTGVKDAQNILTELKEEGINDIVLRYTNWEKDSLRDKLPLSPSVDSALGSKSDLLNIIKYAKDNDIYFYPDINFLNYKSYTFGYSANKTAVRSISNILSRLKIFRLSTKEIDRTQNQLYLLSFGYLEKVMQSFINSFKNYNSDSLSLNSLGSMLYTDYNKDNYITKEKAITNINTSIANIGGNIKNILAEAANDYMIPNSDHIINIPGDSSGYQLIDEVVPFYQMVIHGFVSYSGPPVNMSSDNKNILLRQIELGAAPYYIWISNDPTILLETPMSKYYSTNYKYWFDKAVNEYKETFNYYNSIKDKKMIEHVKLVDGVYKTSYEGGISVIVNYNSYSVQVNEGLIQPQNFILAQGGKIVK